MKPTFKYLLMLMLIPASSFPALSFAQQFPPAELELIELADDLYVIHNSFVPGNVTALITDEGILLVDDKFEASVDDMLELLSTVTDQEIRYVVNTHYHGDHTGGNVRLQTMGAEVVASENARLKMIEAGQSGQPNISMSEKTYIHIGGHSVELYHFGRSHTDGDVVVLFPEHRVLALGDMVTLGEDTPMLIDYSGGGSLRAWTRTLDEVLKLDFDTAVPGHGEVASKDDIREFRNEAVRLRELVRSMIRDDASRNDIEQMLRDEFNWADLQISRGLDGMLVELQ